MRRLVVPLLGLVLMAPETISAGPFSRKPKSGSPDRASQLFATLKNDADASKRARAAEQLGDFDAKVVPEIIPNLVEAVQRDPNSAVRSEAVGSLARIRPASKAAAQTLEFASRYDPSRFVRLKASTSRLNYRFATFWSSDESAGEIATQPDPVHSNVTQSAKPQPASILSAPAEKTQKPLPLPPLTKSTEPKRLTPETVRVAPLEPAEQDTKQPRGILSAPR